MAHAATAMDKVTVEGCTLRCVVEGEADRPALVLSHMLGTDLTLWDGIAPELARHFRVVRLDARGHGGSGLGEAAVTVERLGRDVVAVLDGLGIERAHFCGISMGGAVGLWLLTHAPARIERAVIADSAAKLGAPEMWNERIAAALADGIDPESTIERWFSPGFAERAPDKVEAVRAMLRETSREGLAACCGALRDLDLREAVRAIANPVLVVHGRDDPSVSAEHAAQLVDTIDGASLIEFDTRHCTLVEVEAEFLAAVVRFLTKAVPRRAAGARAKAVAAKPRAPAKASPQPKSAARRVGARGLVAARQPVARTAPASGKAVATASATRKAAARTVPRQPEPSSLRRRAAAKSTRAAAPRAAEKAAAPDAARKASRKKVAAAAPLPGRSKPAPTRPAVTKPAPTKKAAAKPAPTRAAPAKAAPTKLAPVKSAGKVTPTSTKRGKLVAETAKPVARRAAVPAAKTRPTTAAALRAAAAGKAGGPGKVAKSTAKDAARMKPAPTAPAKTRPAAAKPATSRRVSSKPPHGTGKPPRGPAGRGRR